MELVVKHFSELSVYELYELYKLRVSVFVVEQKCYYQEVDDADPQAWHIFFRDTDGIAACVRLLPPGVTFDTVSIGRVIAARRRLGLGSRIMKEGIRIAREKFGNIPIKIEAQTYARPFYESLGFLASSDEFLEDGIPHLQMTLPPL